MVKKLLSLFILFFGSTTLHAQLDSTKIEQFPHLYNFSSKSVVQQDVLRALSGLHAGIRITSTGGISGSGTNAIIRGFSSLNATSDPLIIVDGIRFDSENYQSSSSFSGGGTLTTPNRSLDIDPSIISNIEVLNSLRATIKYGEDATDGVILITTNRDLHQKRDDGIEFQIRQGFYNTSISSRPEYQNQFGMGFNGSNLLTYSSWGPAFDDDNATLFPGSYVGQNASGNVLINHPLSNESLTRLAFPEFANESYPYVAQSTPIESFFEKGLSSNSSIGAKYRSGNYQLNVDYSGNWEEGFTPNNTFNRNGFGVSFFYPLINNVTGKSTLSFTFVDVETPTLSAGGGSGRDQFDAGPSVFSDVFYTPRSIGFDFPFQNPETGGSAYYRVGNDIINPRWTTNNSKSSDKTNRIFGKTEVEFTPSKNLSIYYKYSFESFDENQQYRLNPALVANYAYPTGLFQTVDIDRSHYEQLLMVSYYRNLSNTLNLQTDLGINYQSEYVTESGLESIDILQLGVFNHENFRTQIPISSFTNNLFEFEHERRTFGVFTEVTLDYSQWLYSMIGFRGDWNNSLQHQDLNATYPAFNVGYIPTNQFGSLGPINSLRLEVGYYTSGRGILNEAELRVQDRASVAINPDLKPERSIEREAKISLGLFDDRLQLSTAYFQRTHTDLISRIADSSDPVFSSILDNLMEIESDGIEVTMFAQPITSTINWSILGTFYSIQSEVKEYTGTFNAVQLGNSLPTRGNAALINEPFMSMYGTQILKVTEELKESNSNFANAPIGAPIVDDNGNYINGEVGIIGNPIPKWNASFVNKIDYKNLSLSFQFDYQHGGDMYSTWVAALLGRGVVTETTQQNRERMYVIDGVRLDGTANEIEISSQQYFFNNVGFGPDEARIIDATHFRISHIGIDYTIPNRLLDNTMLNEVIISISVENAFLYMPNVPKSLGFDPNVNSNGAGVNNMGFEHLTGPGARRVGGTVRVNF